VIEFERFADEWLAEVLSGEPSTTQIGNRFAEKILRDWSEIDSTSAEIILCDGAGDGGIDAAVFVPKDPAEGVEGDTWILVQSKYGTSYAGVETILSESQKLFATLEGSRDRLSSVSAELVTRLRNFLANKGSKDRLEYVLATSRRLSQADIKYFNDVRTLGRARFGECFDIDTVSIESIYQRAVELEVSAIQTNWVSLKTTVASSGEILMIGATRLRDVFDFMKSYKAKVGDLDYLYEKNVRKFLGSKRKVNRGIEETIENNPERFGLYNNGITIVSERARQISENEFELENPFIVNGCQTTRSIWSVLQRKLESGGSAPSIARKEWEARLDQAVVITKIVVVGVDGGALLTETTRYTNSQNSVGEKDFIALESDFRNWAPQFNSKYRVFLEIQRGAWEAQRAYQRQHPTSNQQFTESAYAFDLLKIYAAGWFGVPGIAYGKNPPFAPGGSLFKKITGEPGFGVESLYAAFLLQKLAGGYGFGRGSKTPTRGQTRFLFMFVVVDLVRYTLIDLRKSRSHASISQAVRLLTDAGLLSEFGDIAALAVDDYLTRGNEESVFTEPVFEGMQDLNAFLKSERLNDQDFAPRLREQMTMTRKMFKRSVSRTKLEQALLELTVEANA
jgi:hypothetical protein